MNYFEKIIEDIECHSVEGIKECFANGISPNDSYNGQPLIYELTSEYMRSTNFKKCVQAFVDYGLHFEDKLLLAVLLDDAESLLDIMNKFPEAIDKRYILRSAFTPLDKVSLLHICAEFNHIECAKVLIDRGAGIDSKAGIDENGFGGQTPIFHTVNQLLNQSHEMLEFLLCKSCDLDITVKGLIWGKGYEWETFIPAVNPLSYAMMGLLPQMHRSEQQVVSIVERLLRASYGIDYKPRNVPNKYLKK